MLDLNFVRDNLPLVEEKLRQRGMNPAEVLKGFRELDTNRRQAITEAESLQARRNRASEEIAKLKKSGQDASATALALPCTRSCAPSSNRRWLTLCLTCIPANTAIPRYFRPTW